VISDVATAALDEPTAPSAPENLFSEFNVARQSARN